ncbi:4-hydroxy-tetrahydrodipicolinate synthase [Haloactinopolyspora alba]|uniref:4-hydroxy-tetrahydrodipicolinate synthase n=1 Tax=Haloactinopolyspora alba TaxID=648780 RepID=A0A2P8EG20_9ACTN|nr:dihydrodipicolinate synthase family protein [Haloactinopolyspora alba]PSL08409.1 4-hydroxy-tetrahydrodipicolinate synthase [Haloactinopolyspora alba]
MVSAADLSGVHVALATPVSDDGTTLDHEGLARLVDRAVTGGVRAVCPAGSTGEGPRLTRSARREVTSAVRGLVPAGTPVVPAPSAMTARDAIKEIAGLADAGADAVLLAPPSYYPMAPDEVTDHMLAVADAAAVPMVLYNIPGMTGVSLPADVVARLAAHERVVGVKDSSRDLEYLQSVLYAVGDTEFAVLTGSDTMLLASLVLGASGTIAASANLVPGLGRAVYDAVLAGELAAAGTAQRQLFDVIQACRAGTLPAGWKAALSLAGLCSAAPVAPAAPLDPGRRAALADRLRELHAI